MDEQPLVGGRQAAGIVRVGDTVRRPLHPNAAFVHALLCHLEACGFDGAPRLLGIDDEGREILTYVEGRVYAGRDDDELELLTDAQLASSGRLIRRFHDATAGSPLAGSAEVVCHSDLGQHNMVFRGSRAVAIIDWDEHVAPGTRAVDLSHAVWCLAEIGEQGGPVAEQARRMQIACDAYGWEDRAALIHELELRFRRALAEARERGRREGVRIWSELLDWLSEHGPQLAARR